jgi:hypothetical protein
MSDRYTVVEASEGSTFEGFAIHDVQHDELITEQSMGRESAEFLAGQWNRQEDLDEAVREDLGPKA